LRKQFEGKYNFQTESDCEVILATKGKRAHFIDEMNGIFGFAIYDVDKDEYFVAVTIWNYSIIYGWDQHGTFYVASELKALEGYCTNTTVSSWTLYDK
jgi:asparagine synthase (glutamine-hydrolysing)